nr:uncharacterized protein At5g08430-like [Ipomoea trifida]
MEIGSGSNKMKVQNKKRKSKLEFLGWGSKPLIELLDSIGKESRQYSQGEVDAIIKKYVASNNLIDPTNKRRIIENHDDDVDNAPALRNLNNPFEKGFRLCSQFHFSPLFSLRLRLGFFQSVAKELEPEPPLMGAPTSQELKEKAS